MLSGYFLVLNYLFEVETETTISMHFSGSDTTSTKKDLLVNIRQQ